MRPGPSASPFRLWSQRRQSKYQWIPHCFRLIPAEEVQLANSIFPNRGTRSGGTIIRIVGREFVSGMQVRIGFAAAVRQGHQRKHLRCETPPSDLLGQPMSLSNGRWRRRGNPAGAFSYYEPVVLEAVEPRRGPASGGYPVVIRGTGFVGGSVVTSWRSTSSGREVSDDTRSAIVRCPEGSLEMQISPFATSTASILWRMDFSGTKSFSLSPSFQHGGGYPVVKRWS